MNNPVRFVLIGAGGISRAYAVAFDGDERLKLAGVCDIRETAASEVAEIAGAEAFTDVDAMCDRLRPDAAIVCTPPSTHPKICVSLMNLGIHVLCEKPMAITSTEARRMIAAADVNNVLLTMGSKFRFVEDVIKARRIIDSGQIGDVILFENTFAGYVDMSKRWNSNPEISGGGVLIDNGTHSVDILRFLLGSIVDLQVVEGRRVQRLPVEDTVRLFTHTKSGAMGSIDLSWSMNKVQPHFISIYGSAGTLLVGWRESKYRRSGDNEWTVFGTGYDKVVAFRNQLINFADAVRGKAELHITSEDALASVQVIETAYRAMATEQWYPVEEDRTWERGTMAESSTRSLSRF